MSCSRQPYGMLSLAITQRCNLRCSHCYTSAGRSTPELSADDLTKLLDQFLVAYAPNTAAIDVTVTGGEPLLRREETLALLHGAATHSLRRHGDDLALNTNAMLVDGDVAAELASIDGLRIWVSLDGDAEAHDALRGRSFEPTLRGLQILAAAGCQVGVGLTPSGFNQGTIERTAEIAFSAGADRFVVQFPMLVGRWSGFDLAGRIRALHDELRALHARFGDRVGSPLSKMDQHRTRSGCHECPVGKNVTFHVMPTGDIYPCYALIGSPFSIGTVQDWPRSFAEFVRRLRRFDQHRSALATQFDVGCLVSCPGTVAEGAAVPESWQRLDEALHAVAS